MGRPHPGGHLPHEVASPRSDGMPNFGHSWCARPTRGHDPGAMLPALFWSRPTVSVLSHPSPGSRPYDGLVDAPVVSYTAMASSTETPASTLAVGVTPSSYQTSRLPPLEPMDTMPPLTTENLLLTAGVSRGTRGWTPLWTPTVLGPSQPGPRMPHPQVPTRGRQGATSSTPYQALPP